MGFGVFLDWLLRSLKCIELQENAVLDRFIAGIFITMISKLL